MNSHIFELLNTTQDALIQKFHKEIQDIFTTMVGIDDLMHLPIQVDPRSHFADCITSMVGFAGLFNGILSLHVPENLALLFTSSMLGMEVTEINDDVHDALGEIANMIAGSFKHHLAQNGQEVRLSTPTIITGKEYMFTSGAIEDTLTLLYDSNGEWLLVSIVVEQND